MTAIALVKECVKAVAESLVKTLVVVAALFSDDGTNRGSYNNYNQAGAFITSFGDYRTDVNQFTAHGIWHQTFNQPAASLVFTFTLRENVTSGFVSLWFRMSGNAAGAYPANAMYVKIEHTVLRLYRRDSGADTLIGAYSAWSMGSGTEDGSLVRVTVTYNASDDIDVQVEINSGAGFVDYGTLSNLTENLSRGGFFGFDMQDGGNGQWVGVAGPIAINAA